MIMKITIYFPKHFELGNADLKQARYVESRCLKSNKSYMNKHESEFKLLSPLQRDLFTTADETETNPDAPIS